MKRLLEQERASHESQRRAFCDAMYHLEQLRKENIALKFGIYSRIKRYWRTTE